MKSKLKVFVMISLVVLLALPVAGASASNGQLQETISNGKLVLGGYYNLAEGQTLEGGMLILGGTVDLAPTSTVVGDVAMLGGNLRADGKITGSLLSLGGLVRLSASTTINGDVNAFGGDLQGEELAAIAGLVSTDSSSSFPLVLPGGFEVLVPNIDFQFNPLLDFLWLLVQSLVWAALAVLVVLFTPAATRRVGQTVVSQPLVSGGMGLLTTLAAGMAVVLLAITLICSPLALLAAIILAAAWVFGVIALGVESGERLAKMVQRDWPLPLSAALGAFGITLVTGVIGKIPCVGWVAPFLVGVLGIGAVLLTRFGTRPYPTEIISAPPPVENQ